MASPLIDGNHYVVKNVSYELKGNLINRIVKQLTLSNDSRIQENNNMKREVNIPSMLFSL